MFYHRKELMYDVKIQGADPRFGQMLLEQFGGATGELSAALTYWTQSFHVRTRPSATCCMTSLSRSSAISRWSAG